MYKTVGGCTYWFTAALVVAELLIVGMLLTRIRNIWFYFFSSCVLFIFGQVIVSCGFSIFEQYPSLPWQYKHGLYAIVFMALGGLYWKYESFVNSLMNLYALVGMMVAYVVCLVMLPEYFKVLVSMLDVNVSGIALSILSTLILIELCKKLPSSKLLNYVGQNTICFRFMSGALPIVVGMIVKRFLGINALGFMVDFFICITLAYLGTYIITRWMPWLLDLRMFKKQDS